MEILQLDNTTVRRHVPIAGTLGEGYFLRYASDAARGPLGQVLDLSAIAEHYGTLAAFLASVGEPLLPALGEEAAACFAFLAGMASLDVNVAQSGFTVTDAQGLSPASAHRVQALREHITQRAHSALASLMEGLWQAFPRLDDKAKMCLRASPYRDGLCCSPSAFCQAGGPLGITSADYFAGVGLMHEIESALAPSLLGEAFYRHQAERASGRIAEPVSEPVRCLQSAIYLRTAGVLKNSPLLEAFVGPRLQEARTLLQRNRDKYPLWAGTPHDDGRTPVYKDDPAHGSFFRC